MKYAAAGPDSLGQGGDLGILAERSTRYWEAGKVNRAQFKCVKDAIGNEALFFQGW